MKKGGERHDRADFCFDRIVGRNKRPEPALENRVEKSYSPAMVILRQCRFAKQKHELRMPFFNGRRRSQSQGLVSPPEFEETACHSHAGRFAKLRPAAGEIPAVAVDREGLFHATKVEEGAAGEKSRHRLDDPA